MKVVSSFDCWSSFICQYLDFTSTRVNHLAPYSLETTSSKRSLSMALFKFFGFRFYLTNPFVLETHTNEFIHKVGFVMPCFTSEFNSVLNLSLGGAFHGGWTTVRTLGSLFIVCSFGRHPIPSYTSGNSIRIWTVIWLLLVRVARFYSQVK